MAGSQEWARRYAERGLCPIPIPHRAKGPRITGWTELRIKPGEVNQYFDNVLDDIYREMTADRAR